MRKWLIMTLLAGSVWFTGCQKDSSLTPDTETSSDLETIVASAARYAVSTDSVTVRKCKGKLTEVATADLPEAVATYIATNYAGAEVKFAAKDAEGKIVVALVQADGTPIGLLFNADGTFKEVLKLPAHKAKLTKVETANLPAALTAYITANYAGAVIKQAATNADGEYLVAIKSGDAVKVLLFNADGTFNKELDKPALPHGRPHKKK